MKPFNQLTPGEAERLALLLEEMGEATQVIGKILRHGYASHHPTDSHRTPNRKLLERELGDVLGAIDIMLHAGDLNAGSIALARAEKPLRSAPYFHHQRRRAA